MQHQRRRELGAYYTPSDLAQFLADWAVISPDMTVLEPSVGQGALVQAALNNLDRAKGGRIIGCEIDEETYLVATNAFREEPVSIHNVDFLQLAPGNLKPVDAVVANPPFTRNHRLPQHIRHSLRSRHEFANIIKGAAGLWVYFILSSCSYLKLGGRLAFVAPGAINFADYAKPLLDHLCSRFRSVTLASIDGVVDWEGAAQERPTVVLAEGFGLGPCQVARTSISLSSAENGSIRQEAVLHEPMSTPLGNIARLEIGVVTGANATFVISASQASAHALPASALKPIISRTRHLKGLSISAEELRSLASSGERTLLFLPENLGSKSSANRRYLATIPAEQVQNTVWFAKRNPWWRVQIGAPCDAVFTYMNDIGPRLALAKDLTCTNTLHRVSFQNRDPDFARTVCVSMLTTFTQLAAEKVGRVYGGGLLKFELKDARRLPILLPNALVTKRDFDKVDFVMRTEGQEAAASVSDEIILPEFFGSRWRRSQEDFVRPLATHRAKRRMAT